MHQSFSRFIPLVIITGLLGLPLTGHTWVEDGGDAARATIDQAPYADDHILVRFTAAPGFRIGNAPSVNAALGGRTVRTFSRFDGLQVVRAERGQSVRAMLAAYRGHPDVVYAEPDYYWRAQLTPNDPLFSQQYGLENNGDSGTADADINAASAWDESTGSADTIVAVIDTGVDYNHPDLAGNMWQNPNEIAGNGVDDDGNGYVDDIHGINAIDGTGDPMDDYGHGTHVTGILGAVGNNAIGIAGVNWDVSVIACKFIDANNQGLTSDAIECLDYLLNLKNQGVDIVLSNNSWGGNVFSRALKEAIESQQAADILFVAAAGNSALDTDRVPAYPAAYDLPGIVSVAATDADDSLASFSNYGLSSIDVGAPGVNIVSTLPSGTCALCSASGYGPQTGTSMATPHVSGLAALLKSNDPDLSLVELRNLIFSSGQTISALHDRTATAKRIRAADVNGVGALTCADQSVSGRLAPSRASAVIDEGQSVALQYLNITCEQSSGSAPAAVTAFPGALALSLADDGTQGDTFANDGIVTGSYAPLIHGTIQLPAGSAITRSTIDTVPIQLLRNYQAPVLTGYDLRSTTALPSISQWNGDDGAILAALPFAVPFGGTSDLFTLAFWGADGYVSFNSLLPATNFALPLQGAGSLIAPFWDDFNVTNNAAGEARAAVIGSAPNRELVLEWNNMAHEASTSNTATFQIVLFENSPDVLVNYADTTFGNGAIDNGASATVGLQASSDLSQQYSFNSASLGGGTALLWELEHSPFAFPGIAQVVNFGDTVTLDGSASDDPGGAIIVYNWNQVSGTAISLSGTATATASFTAPADPGLFVFSLAVEDDGGLTDTEEVTVRVNDPPVINAADTQVVSADDTVTLTATVTDSDGTIATYQWEQTNGPAVTLTSADTAEPTFASPDKSSTMTFRLTVTDNDGGQDIDTITVAVIDTTPLGGGGAVGYWAFAWLTALGGLLRRMQRRGGAAHR